MKNINWNDVQEATDVVTCLLAAMLPVSARQRTNQQRSA